MPSVLVCTSHSPLLNFPGSAPADVEREIRAHTRELVRFVASRPNVERVFDEVQVGAQRPPQRHD